jgi:hypothetical protein
MHGGDLEVLNAFVVPSEAPWPEETRGVKLGHRVHNFRNHKQHLKHHPERRAELDALGSVYSCGTIWSGGGRRCAPRCWRTRRCTVQVPGAFVRPPEAPWPERRYGVSQEHFVEDHPERRAELDALGFVWDDLERRWGEVRAALLAQQQVHGDLQVPGAFVVPSEAPWRGPRRCGGCSSGTG